MIPIINLGFIQIPTYFLVISLSLTVLLFYLSKRVDQFEVDRKMAFDIAILLMVSGFIGGRLLHVIFEEPDYYLNSPKQILFFWNGGFVYFGGLILSSICVWLYCAYKKVSFLKWADFCTVLLSLSHALGRIGCILAGCCFGSYCTLPWALDGRHPTASYLALGEFFIFFIILAFEKIAKSKSTESVEAWPGHLFFKWLFLHSLLRYFVEFYRDDFRGRFFHLPALGAISVSQLICLSLMAVSCAFFVLNYLKTQFKSRNNI